MLTRPGVTTAPPSETALVRLGRRTAAGLEHEAVLDQDPAVRVLCLRVVHRDDVRVGEQGLHGSVPYLCRVEVLSPRTLDEALGSRPSAPMPVPSQAAPTCSWS